MSDFRLKVQAQLDAKQLTSELNALKNQYKKIPISVDLKGENKLDSLKTNIEFLQGAKGIHINVDTASLKEASTDLKNLATVVKGLKDTKISNQMKSIGEGAGKSYVTAMQKQIDAMSKSQQNAFSRPLNNITKAQQNYSDWWNKVLKTEEASAVNLQFKLDTKGVDVELSKIQNQINKFATQTFTQDQFSQLNNIKSNFSDLNRLVEEFNGKELDSTDVDNYNAKLKTTQNLLQILSNDLSGSTTDSERSRLISRMDSWLNTNTKATKEARENVRGYIADIESAGDSLTKGQFKSITSSFNKTNAEMISMGKTGKSFLSELSRGFKQIGEFAYTYGAIQKLQTTFTESISELKEIDSILTEISKTSNLTTSQIKELGTSSFDSASKWGKSASDYLTGIQEMSRSGYYGKNAENMANLSILAQAAGDLTADSANNYLLASNAAYKYQGNVEKLNAVLDGQNEITNRNSVSMADMAAATTKAASMASEMGVKENELSAMIGTIEARTKAGGDEVGTGIKSLLINLQNINNSKIVGTLQKAGISMTELKNGIEEMRDPISILEDLQKVFNSLDKSDPLRSEILTNIGQKYHANQLSALLSGWDDYKKMLQDYADGTGSAAEEAKKSANNWEGSANKLSNAFTKLVSNFADSDAIITGTNALTGLLNVFDGFIGKAGALQSVAAIIGGIFTTKNGWGKHLIYVLS